jgi:hypothetical protein
MQQAIWIPNFEVRIFHRSSIVWDTGKGGTSVSRRPITRIFQIRPTTNTRNSALDIRQMRPSCMRSPMGRVTEYNRPGKREIARAKRKPPA